MPSNDYHFVTRWRLQGTAEEVADTLGDATDLPRWWPAVYLDVRELEPGDDHGIGRVIDLYTKGWLPYTLRWRFRVTDVDRPHGFALEAWGDFVGRGVWTFEQDGPFVDVTYDWRIRARKMLLRALSPLLKPVFAANHRWAMATGEESLRLELARRNAASPQARAAIPSPPAPTRLRPAPRLFAAAGGALALAVAARFMRRAARRGGDDSAAPRAGS